MCEIIKYPNGILKSKCSPITSVGKEEKDILQKMTEVMYLKGGIGLAACQVGIKKQLAIVDIGDKRLIKLINPSVLEARGRDVMEEGCLSIPNIYVQLKRPKEIKIKSWDENGREFQLEASGLLARAILHEIDHLKGRLIIDYLNPIKRFLTLRGK